MSDKHILILGTGSAGKRHAKNLSDLGCKVSCMDPRQDRLDEAAQAMHVQKGYTSLEAALADASQFSGVAITSPPAFHVEQGLACLDHKLPILLEKPVSPDKASAARLAAAANDAGTPLLLGYTWRWWRPMRKLREMIKKKAVGDIRFVRFTMSAHLADWHPWERYQDFFMASKEQGGGALLDESHWIDIMLWLFGMPTSLFARVEKISDLEITTDDNVDMLVTYPGGMRVSLHLDLYGRPHEKSLRVIGEKGSIEWEPNALRTTGDMEPNWKEEHFSDERNDMFVAVAEEFLLMLDSGITPSCHIDEGVRVLELVEAARESSNTGRAIDFA